MDKDDQLLFDEFDNPSSVELPEPPSHSIITYPAVPTHKIVAKSGMQTEYIGEFHHFDCYKDIANNLQPNQAFVPLYKAIRGEKTIYFVIKNKSVIYVLNSSGVKYYYDYYVKYHTRIYPLEFYNTISQVRDYKYDPKLSPYSIPFKNGSINNILDDFLSYLDLHINRSTIGGKTRRKKNKTKQTRQQKNKPLTKHAKKKRKKQSKLKK